MMLVHNEGASPLEPQGLELLRNYPRRAILLSRPCLHRWRRFLTIQTCHWRRSCATANDMSIVVRAALKAWIGRSHAIQSFELRQRLESSAYLQ